MSKLSPSLKALINAPFARPGPAPAPALIRDVYQAIAHSAAQHNLGTRPWLALSTAATFTLNSPDALPVLHDVASVHGDVTPVQAAELMREAGLKCISFNGIPRTINCLNGFDASLSQRTRAGLSRRPSRVVTSQTLAGVESRGRKLWGSIYAPFETKLVEKLAGAHPDLPVHILGCHYGPLLADPPGDGERTGRVLTSLVAVACLRAQTGVGPQVLSHVFGLRKAYEDGSYVHDEPCVDEKTMAWLAGDEGLEWVLKTVDRLVGVFGGSSFAPSGPESKL